MKKFILSELSLMPRFVQAAFLAVFFWLFIFGVWAVMILYPVTIFVIPAMVVLVLTIWVIHESLGGH